MDPIVITFVILGLAVVVFVWNRIPVSVVAVGVALSLYATGVLTADQALAGFGDPVIVLIAALFVVSEGLDATGVTTWAGQQLVQRAGTKPSRIVFLVMLLVAVLSALISVNGAVAALLPMVVVLAVRIHQPPSRLLMPLAFGAHAGSLLVLTGSPVSVLIVEYLVGAGEEQVGFFEFGLVGIPLLVGTLLITVLFGRWLLPSRVPEYATRDLSSHAQTLARQYELADGAKPTLTSEKGLAEVVIPPRSALIGEVAFPGMVTESGELVVVAIQRGGEELARTTLQVGDVLLLQGTWGALDANTADPNVLVVDAPSTIRRQAAPLARIRAAGKSRRAAT